MFENIAKELGVSLSALDEKGYLFEDVVEVAKIHPTWLRTFIQRDWNSVLVSRHRSGRLEFSLRNVVSIIILHDLNYYLKVTPSHAWNMLTEFEWSLNDDDEEKFFDPPFGFGPVVRFRYRRIMEPLITLLGRDPSHGA